jgi:hypothetical protein
MKRFLAVLAMTAGLSGALAGSLATPASAQSALPLCVRITVSVSGSVVVPTTMVCVPPA